MLNRPKLKMMLLAFLAAMATGLTAQASPFDRYMSCQLNVEHSGTVDFEASLRAPALKFTMSDSGEVSHHNRMSLIYESALDNQDREITLIPELAVEQDSLVFKGFNANIKNLSDKKSLVGKYDELPRHDKTRAQLIYRAQSSTSTEVVITLKAVCSLTPAAS